MMFLDNIYHCIWTNLCGLNITSSKIVITMFKSAAKNLSFSFWNWDSR